MSAIDGNFEDSLEALIEWWKIGQHYSNRKTLWLQPEIRTKSQVLKTASLILDYFAMDANTLRLWQDKWQKQVDADKFVPDFQTNKLFYYDEIQRTFNYHPKGRGKLSLRRAIAYSNPCCDLSFSKMLHSILTCPDSNEVCRIVSSVCDYYQNIVDKTPYEIRLSEAEFENNLEKIKNKQPIFNSFIPLLRPFFYHGLKAQSDALVTVIAVKRYKADHNTYPDNLEVLLKDKYLEKLPKDPFSDGLLVYRLLNDEFELYSVGVDFIDDGGKGVWGHDLMFAVNDKGDEVFWPPLKRDLQHRKFYRFKSEQ